MSSSKRKSPKKMKRVSKSKAVTIRRRKLAPANDIEIEFDIDAELDARLNNPSTALASGGLNGNGHSNGNGQDLPIRAQVLNDARDLTLGDRNRQYNDPLFNFQAISTLKDVFWTMRERAGNHEQLTQNTPFGHSIDMVLMNLGRLATAPNREAILDIDRFKDGVNYLAIAFEVAKRSS